MTRCSGMGWGRGILKPGYMKIYIEIICSVWFLFLAAVSPNHFCKQRNYFRVLANCWSETVWKLKCRFTNPEGGYNWDKQQHQQHHQQQQQQQQQHLYLPCTYIYAYMVREKKNCLYLIKPGAEIILRFSSQFSRF